MLYFGIGIDSDDPKIRIFGTPEGLRYLAKLLTLMADDPQTDLVAHEPAEFSQLRRDDSKNPILEESFSATVGRIDHKIDGSCDWFLDAVRFEDCSSNIVRKLMRLWESNPDIIKSVEGNEEEKKT